MGDESGHRNGRINCTELTESCKRMSLCARSAGPHDARGRLRQGLKLTCQASHVLQKHLPR